MLKAHVSLPPPTPTTPPTELRLSRQEFWNHSGPPGRRARAWRPTHTVDFGGRVKARLKWFFGRRDSQHWHNELTVSSCWQNVRIACKMSVFDLSRIKMNTIEEMICATDTWIRLPATDWDQSHPVIMHSLPTSAAHWQEGKCHLTARALWGAGLAWSGGGLGRGWGGGDKPLPLFPDRSASVFLFTPHGFGSPIFHWLSGRIITELSPRGKKLRQSIQLLVWCEGMFGSQLGGTEVGVKQQDLQMNMWRFHF